MSQQIVSLRPLTRTDLAAIAPWFEDPETHRYLGGPDWPRAMLDHGERAAGQMYRGAIQTAAHHYFAELDGRGVGYIDCGTFDRATVYGGEGPDGPVIRVDRGEDRVNRVRRPPGASPPRNWDDDHPLLARRELAFVGMLCYRAVRPAEDAR